MEEERRSFAGFKAGVMAVVLAGLLGSCGGYAIGYQRGTADWYGSHVGGPGRFEIPRRLYTSDAAWEEAKRQARAE